MVVTETGIIINRPILSARYTIIMYTKNDKQPFLLT